MGIIEYFLFFPLSLAACLRVVLTVFAVCYLMQWFGLCGRRHHHVLDEDLE